MMRRHGRCGLTLVVLLGCLATRVGAAELDAAQAAQLGVEPAVAATMTVILDDGVEPAPAQARDGYNPSQDLVSVWFAPLGGDRYLWRLDLAGPATPEQSVHHLYLDADDNPATGRQGPANAPNTGCDYMLSVAAGRANPQAFTADGERGPQPAMAFVAAGRSIWIAATCQLGRDADGIRYRLYVLNHTAVAVGERPPMNDSTEKVLVSGIAPFTPPASPRLAAVADDADADGLSTAEEAILGTDPNRAEVLYPVLHDGVESDAARAAQPRYDPGLDIVAVHFGHIAEDRYLWRIEMAGPATSEAAVLHLYVDADANPATGRTGAASVPSTGCDYMLSAIGGRPSPRGFTADGSPTSGPNMAVVYSGNNVWISADCELGRDAGRIRFDTYALSHTAADAEGKVAMSDSTAKVAVRDIPTVPGQKIRRPADLTENFQVSATFGLDLLRPIVLDPTVPQVRYDQMALDGFELDHQTTRRDGHLKAVGAGAKASAKPPVAGRWHVGFMMYDDGADERIGIRINDELAGVAVANQDNYYEWLYWLDEPRDLTTDDTITLEALGAGGKHGVINLIFLAAPPETRQVEYTIDNLVSHVPTGSNGEVILSWTTSWPSATAFDYGRSTDYGSTASEECYRLVHRVRLTGLADGVVYHGRAAAKRRDGSVYHSSDFTFSTARPEAPFSPAGGAVPLLVRNTTGHAGVWPVTGGVPMPVGVLADDAQVRVVKDGVAIPAQIETTGHWPDGSVKWLLVSFAAEVVASGDTAYTLEFGPRVTSPAGIEPLAVAGADGLALGSAAARVALDAHGQIAGLEGGGKSWLRPGGAVTTTLRPAAGPVASSAGASAETSLETNGPLRAVALSRLPLTAADGSESFAIEQRVTVYRGVPLVRIQHTFTNTLPDRFTELESLSLDLPVIGEGWRALLASGQTLPVTAPGSTLHQRDDRSLLVAGEVTDGRLTGTLLGSDSGPAVILRDAWQQYPKAFERLADGGLRVDLAPDFEPGYYDSFPFEKEGHQLFFYLLGGRYKFRHGMAKTHELTLVLGSPAEQAALGAMAQEPPVLVADPAWVCASRAFYDIAPRDTERFAAYEAAMDRNLVAYAQGRERQRDYGLMNFGDWYGERGANWGNIEYDTQHCFMMEFARSGNPQAFRLACDTTLHNRDIDTVWWAPNPSQVGLVLIHQMGHVGGYYTESVPGTLGIPSAGGSVSHAWVEGHFNHYFLTGDRRSLEAGRMIADHFINQHLSRPYDFADCRVPGWHLIMNASALASTGDPYYLNASRVIVDRVLANQDRLPRPLPWYQEDGDRTHQVGGWSRMMVPGHTERTPRSRGNANFMVAVLLSGLKYYHDVTDDPAVKESIILGAHYLMDECYSTEVHGFRYTSCPGMPYRSGVTPLMAEGIARAYRWTRDERFLDPLTIGLSMGAGGYGYGKSFSMYYRVAPRVLADLAEVGLTMDEQIKPELAKFSPPDWLTALADDQRIVLQAEAHTGEGGGLSQTRDDREATWGSMVTFWHQDVGHWLSWQFTPPRPGRYQVVVRYCSGSDNPRRKLELNGVVPDPAVESIAFAPTGGFGTAVSHWRYETIKGADGQPLVLDLGAGEQTLLLTNLGDGMGLDFIVLVRQND